MNPKRVRGKIDWMITLVPLAIVVALCILFFLVPEQSNAVLSQIRFFFRRYLWHLLSGDWTGYFHPVTVHCVFEVWGYCSG